MVYHAGLFGAGLGLGYLAYPQNFNLHIFSAFAVFDLMAAIWLSWIASVIVNDIYDFEVDVVSNPGRPLQQNVFSVREYAELGAVIFFLALLGGLVVSFKFAALLLVYQFLAWVYSARPYRLKRFPGIATFVSACASLIILFIGFALFSGDQNLQGLSWRIILLLLLTLTLSLPIKDFKDIEGDKKEGIWTIPVLFGEEKGRLIVASGVFVSFILSVFLLNEFRLFWWAAVFGGMAFLIVTNKKINPRRFFWWVLFPVTVYGLVLMKILFF
jgi:4-hydroxybenzoate polyprenyltransferase